MRSSTEQQVAVDMAAVKRAFKALRSQGVIAHVASGGCRCCYSRDTEQAEKTPTAWGAANLWRDDLEQDPTGAYIRFDAVDGRGRTDAEVGQAIVAALAAEGVETEWQGDPSICVRVKGTERPDTDAARDACYAMDGALGQARAAVQDAVRDVGHKVLGMPVRERAGLLASTAYHNLGGALGDLNDTKHDKARAWDKALAAAFDTRTTQARDLLVALDKAAQALEDKA